MQHKKCKCGSSNVHVVKDPFEKDNMFRFIYVECWDCYWTSENVKLTDDRKKDIERAWQLWDEQVFDDNECE